jgi:Holliday junction resolvase RusA-like endonuclease
VIEFTVLGRAQPAGSKRQVTNRKTGQTFVVDDNPRSRPWKELVTSAAVDAMGARAGATGCHGALEGALLLEVDFYLARPAGHFGTGRNRGIVRDSAPPFPAVRPDVTKLLRGLEDALTGVVWRDDAQVVDQIARKRYGWPERAEVRVLTVDEFLTLDDLAPVAMPVDDVELDPLQLFDGKETP